jgi:S1-C subfamily serine protease
MNNLFRSIPRATLAGFGITLIGIVGLASAFATYEIRTQAETNERIANIENQLSRLTDAITEGATLDAETKAELKEISNRTNVIAKSQDELLTAAVAQVSPTVVSIVVSKDVPKLQVFYEDPFGGDPFFGDSGIRIPVYKQIGTEKQQIGAGTGFIIRENGYILTNQHVVSDQTAEYTVLLSTGAQRTARVVHRDSANDLALLKIDGSGYPVANLGDSSSIQLGQTVAAIGNALGEYSNSVSVGIVSGLDRTIEASDSTGRIKKLSGVVQTDAAINPGNSGGPLLDLNGNIIGVNVAIIQGSNNVAFSIPINTAKEIINRAL